jgi:hypothetical protein
LLCYLIYHPAGKRNETGVKMAAPKDSPTNTRERLATAQWVLERQLAWIAAVEVKVGVIITLNLAMLSGLAALGVFNSATVTATRINPLIIIGMTMLSALPGIAGLIFAICAVLPQTNGPQDSLFFFGTISKQDVSRYCTRFKQATDDQLLEDWTTQIHRNAEIAKNKYAQVKNSMFFSFLAAFFWIIEITLFIKI